MGAEKLGAEKSLQLLFMWSDQLNTTRLTQTDTSRYNIEILQAHYDIFVIFKQFFVTCLVLE